MTYCFEYQNNEFQVTCRSYTAAVFHLNAFIAEAHPTTSPDDWAFTGEYNDDADPEEEE